ncbi:MAG: SDR family NAD(P)-dependent oxidoreductase [Nanoarchaeota archaeon]
MRYLITGGAGFIGSHIAEELVSKGEEVIIFDDLSAGRPENIKHIKEKIKFVRGDIRNFSLVKKAMKNVDYVSHQAAKTSVRASVENASEFNEVNVIGAYNVLKAASERGVKKVVYASSSSVYGDSSKFPLKETFNPKPKSPYSITKYFGELYCKYFFEEHGLDIVSLRYFNVFGARQNYAGEYANAIPSFITRMLKDQQPILYGDGQQSRDFIYVKDVVAANLLACKANKINDLVINVCSGKSVSLIELVSRINRLLGKEIKPEFIDSQKADINKTLGDSTLSKGLLGFKPKVSFGKGLRETVEWFKCCVK